MFIYLQVSPTIDDHGVKYTIRKKHLLKLIPSNLWILDIINDMIQVKNKWELKKSFGVVLKVTYEDLYHIDLLSDEAILETFELSEWTLDFGASKHFTGNYFTFDKINHSHSSTITLARNNVHVIAGKWSINLSMPTREIKTLKRVYYVLGLRRNILSIE